MVTKPAADYTVQEFDEYIVYESGSHTVVLPYATGDFREIRIINLGSGTIKVQTQPLDKIHLNQYYDIGVGESLHIIDIELQNWIIL